ncbi:MAG: inositol monophosphatase [Chloroflexi bacterium]|nr:inositol monophosphatase [Chloroflexota bacterium]
MSQRLETAITAARTAGKILRQKLNARREVHAKGRRDIVTDADYAADRAVRSVCRARHPKDHFLSEEDSAERRGELWRLVEENEEERLWVVDPLDGTTNYARRLPSFCVSIALYQRRAVQIGVVYDPLCDELFAAERGAGALLNERRMVVSTTRRFAHAVIGTEWARGQKPRERTAEVFARMVGRATTARVFGSAALSLCYVGAARLDGYFHLSLSPWDMAAAALIVEEAGGRVSTIDGKRWDLHSQGYIASNGHLHRQLLKYFRTD